MGNGPAHLNDEGSPPEHPKQRLDLRSAKALPEELGHPVAAISTVYAPHVFLSSVVSLWSDKEVKHMNNRQNSTSHGATELIISAVAYAVAGVL